MSSLHPAWVEIDLGALHSNVELLRARIGPRTKLVAVVKSNGFGCGVADAARVVMQAGADGLAVGSPDDVEAIRASDNAAPILLYASTLPEDAPEVARLGATVTIHDMDSLHAFSAVDARVDAYAKIETGLGRLGLESNMWSEAFRIARESHSLRLRGLYTHLNAPDDKAAIARQVEQFDTACEAATVAQLGGLTRMVASSHVALAYPELNYDAVNAGRLLFGLLEGAWAEMAPVKPVIASIKSRLIQIKSFAKGTYVGFLGTPSAPAPVRLAVAPIGFGDGFNHLPPAGQTLGEVLIGGKRAPVVGRRGIEHTVIDVTDIDTAAVGDEVVLLGVQGDGVISPVELSNWLATPQLELLPRLARTLPRRYIN